MYVWPRNRRLGRRWLISVVCTYLLLALPLVANAIADRLPKFLPGDRVLTAGAIDTLIVLDGDNPYGRAAEAVRVYAHASPQRVFVIGDSWIVELLREAGIPGSRLARDSNPPTTRDQISRVKQLIAERPDGRLAVIASRVQMPRIAALSEAARLELVLIPSPLDVEPPTAGIRLFLPNYSSLGLSSEALYEHAALAYYRWRKWI